MAGTLTVTTSGTVTVTAGNVSTIFGTAPATPGDVITGLVDSDSVTGVTCIDNASDTAVGVYPGGTTCTGPSTSTDGNAVTYVAGTLTVTSSGTVTVTAGNVSTVFGTAPATPGDVITGLVDGDSVTGVTCIDNASDTAVGVYPGGTTCTGPSTLD